MLSPILPVSTEASFPPSPPRATVVDAVLQYEGRSSSGITKWRIDQPTGHSVAVGQCITLVDATWHPSATAAHPALPPQLKTSTVHIVRIQELQRHWIVFDISPTSGSTLIAPRSRTTLGLVSAIQHFLLYPWLPDTFPPPFSRPSPHHRPSPNSKQVMPSSTHHWEGEGVRSSMDF